MFDRIEINLLNTSNVLSLHSIVGVPATQRTIGDNAKQNILGLRPSLDLLYNMEELLGKNDIRK
jgi:hypothetical protein